MIYSHYVYMSLLYLIRDMKITLVFFVHVTRKLWSTERSIRFQSPTYISARPFVSEIQDHNYYNYMI